MTQREDRVAELEEEKRGVCESDRDWVADTLYGEHAMVRDEARSHLIRFGTSAETQQVINALKSTMRTTRRRATRLLAELQPHRVTPSLTRFIQSVMSLVAQHELAQQEPVSKVKGAEFKQTEVKQRAQDQRQTEALICTARILTTLAEDRAPVLDLLLDHPHPKVRRAALRD